MSYAVDLSAVRAAQARIAPHVRRTPVHTSSTLDALAGRELFFKCELFQRGGSFKVRGALNAVLSLSEEAAARGIVTHSSGNHAQAVAIAAGIRGVPATIVMPRGAPAVKRAAVAGYGARILECAPTNAARQAAADRVVAETGATFVHPSDQPEVLAGQGTIALELLEQVPDLDALVVPVGGGGLISGITLAARELRPGLQVHGAEPAGADDAWRSRRAGRRLPQEDPRTVADGLRTGLGEHTWPVVRDLLADLHTVSEEEIRGHLRLVWERMKLFIEPSAAVGVAVACTGRLPPELRRVGVILCGGNVDLEARPWEGPPAQAPG